MICEALFLVNCVVTVQFTKPRASQLRSCRGAMNRKELVSLVVDVVY